MFKKYFTIILIPQKTSVIRKIRIPTFGIVIGTFMILALILAWAGMIYDYFSIRSRLINIEQAKTSFEEKKKQLEEFTEKYKSIQMHFEHLKSLNYKLRLFTSLERDGRKKRTILSEEEKTAQIKLARSDGILAIISSDADEIDVNLNYERFKFSNLARFFSINECPLNRIPQGQPVKGLFMNEYGVRADPITNQIISKHGINIATSNNSPVHSTASGLVLYVGKDSDLKNLLILDHGNGYITRYGYIGNIKVKEGELVKKGDVIARTNSTEESIESHLYYEVTLNHITRNPIRHVK